LLQQGEKVTALKRPSSDLTFFHKIFHHYSGRAKELLDEITWVDGDITDIASLENAMDGVDKIYHCAAIISFLPGDFNKMLHVNVEGTANVVNAALVKGVSKLCHVSSIAALGRSEEKNSSIDETLPWTVSRNNSGYSISKHGAEREVLRGIAEGLDAVIVNPSIILGISNAGKGSTRLFSTPWNGLRFYPTGINGFVDVNDVARAMIKLAGSSISGERFILNGVNISYKELFSMIANCLGKKPPQYKAGPLIASLAWRAQALISLFTGKKPLLSRETARTSMNKYAYNSDKIRNAIGFRFTEFEETIHTLGAYYKEEFNSL
jgi:dihydroflavonol-4-reductase